MSSSSSSSTAAAAVVASSKNESNSTQEKEASSPSGPASTTTSTIVHLEIGDVCQVQWRNGPDHRLAKIIETRLAKKRKMKGQSSGGRSTTASKSNNNNDDNDDVDVQKEYYVHYVNHDRRLDEWIDKSRFVLETLQKAPPTDAVTSQEGGRPSRRSAAVAAAAAANNSSSTAAAAGGGNNSTSSSSTLQPLQQHSSSSSSRSHRSSPNTTTTTTTTDPTLAQLEQEHEETTKIKNISQIYMGGWLVEAWYFSPYPDDYAQVDTLYVCEYCLKYMRYPHTYQRHRSECQCRRPPGKEIYRHDDLSVFEVDGREARVYCQNLCLLAKLFLDHKTLYYDVTPFLFYVICHVDEYGAHIVGYFSKEKVSDYNLACILCFPQFQKSGYGKFIISLSYELTKRERKTGSPEKPLSDLGKMAYRSYWTHILMNLLAQPNAKQLTIRAMSEMTGIKTEDIISTLQSLDMIKCWKGQHVVHVKQSVLKEYLKQDKQFRLCQSEYLKWDPPSQRTKE